MKMTLLLALLTAITSCQAIGSSRATRWEYSNVRYAWACTGLRGGCRYELTVDGKTYQNDELWKYIDSYGASGWEMVSAHDDGDLTVLWFKRPL